MAGHTPDEIAELRRLCAEATPGPWTAKAAKTPQANLDRAASDTIRDLMAALDHVVAERAAAYPAGAEAMREAAAKIAGQNIDRYHEGMSAVDVRLSHSRGPKWRDGPAIAAAIRSAPLPERKESEG